MWNKRERTISDQKLILYTENRVVQYHIHQKAATEQWKQNTHSIVVTHPITIHRAIESVCIGVHKRIYNGIIHDSRHEPLPLLHSMPPTTHLSLPLISIHCGWVWTWTIRVVIQISYASSAVVSDIHVPSQSYEFDSNHLSSIFSIPFYLLDKSIVSAAPM